MIEAPGEKNTSTNVVIHVGAIFKHHPAKYIRNVNVFLLCPNTSSQNLWDICSKTMTSTYRAHLQAKVEETDVFQEITYQGPRWSKLLQTHGRTSSLEPCCSQVTHMWWGEGQDCEHLVPEILALSNNFNMFFVGITWSIEILRWKQRFLVVNSFKPWWVLLGGQHKQTIHPFPLVDSWRCGIAERTINPPREIATNSWHPPSIN